MGSSAIRFAERRLLSRRRGPTLLLIIVIALASGAVMATAAGGRRSSTSYDRFLVWAGGGDVITGGMAADSSEEGDAKLSALAALPQVESASRSILIGDGIRLTDGRTFLGTMYPAAFDFTNPAVGRIKVMRGRLPRPEAADEAVVGFVTAERFGIGVGDRIGVLFGAPDEQESQVAPVVITGVIAYPGGFPSLTGRPDSVVGLTLAFQDAHPERVDWTNGSLSVRLRGGSADVGAFREAAAALGFDDVTSTAEQATAVRRLVSVEARALWLVAGILAVTALLVVWQLTRRDASSVADQLRQLHNLGLPDRSIVAAGALRGLRVGSLGALGGMALAVAVSPLFPIGVSRTADPHVGVHFDAVVLIGGAVAAIVLATAFAAAGVRGATRRHASKSRDATILTQAVARLGPVGSTGARLALGTSAASSDTSARAGLGGLLATVAVLVGSASLGSSFDHLLADPALVGGTWDMVVVIEEPAAREQAAAALAGDATVDAFTLGGWTTVLVNGKNVYAMLLEPGRGIEPAVDRGQPPAGPATIALGAAELAALHVSIGDQVDVQLPPQDPSGGGAPGPPVTATVTGRSILASPAYVTLPLGQGGVIPLSLFERLGADTGSVPSYFVKLRKEITLTAGYDDLTAKLHPDFAFPRSDNVGISSLKHIKTITKALYAILATLGATALLHRLLVTTRQNRRLMATLRSLGLTPAQVRRAHMAHGAVVSTVAVAVAIPLGIVVATVTWRHLAEYLGAVAHPATSALITITIAVATAVVGVVIGECVAWREQRISPSQLLRRE